MLRVGGQYDRDAVPPQLVGDRDLPRKLGKLADPLAVENRLGVGLGGLRRPVEDGLHFPGGRKRDDELEKEPVELGFRQRIGSFHLQRVLRSEHEKGPAQVMGLAGDRHRPFLHGLQQRRLGLGRCPVDLVGEHQIGKDRAGLELEPARPFGRLRARRWFRSGLRASDRG